MSKKLAYEVLSDYIVGYCISTVFGSFIHRYTNIYNSEYPSAIKPLFGCMLMFSPQQHVPKLGILIWFSYPNLFK